MKVADEAGLHTVSGEPGPQLGAAVRQEVEVDLGGPYRGCILLSTARQDVEPRGRLEVEHPQPRGRRRGQRAVRLAKQGWRTRSGRESARTTRRARRRRASLSDCLPDG